MDHDRTPHRVTQATDVVTYQPEEAQRIAQARTHLDSAGACCQDESLYRDDEGRWFVVELGDGIPIPRIVALTEDKALNWCQIHGVSRAVIAEHFVVNTRFGPSNELFDLLVRKWSTPLREEDLESGL